MPAESTIEALRRFHLNDELFLLIKEKHGIALTPIQRYAIAASLLVHAQREIAESEAELRNRANKSRMRLANKIGILLRSIESQKNAEFGDGSKSGLIEFLRVSSENFAEDCRTPAEDRMSGKATSRLETLLVEVHQSLRSKLAPLKRHDELFGRLATIYTAAGGAVGATKGGPFARFVTCIVSACPPEVRKHLSSRLDDNIKDWIMDGGWTRPTDFNWTDNPDPKDVPKPTPMTKRYAGDPSTEPATGRRHKLRRSRKKSR